MTAKRGWLAPLALAVVVAAVITTVVLLARSGSAPESSSRPALLHLAGVGAPVEAAASGIASGGSRYVLAGKLPDGQPADQLVWRVTPADSVAARRVARALRLDGEPTRIKGGWVLRAPHANRLLVRADGSWSFGMDCFAGSPIEAESADVMCASAVGGTASAAGGSSNGTAPAVTASPRPTDAPEPVDPPQTLPAPARGPTSAEALRAAGPILDALGLADARATVTDGLPATTVQAAYDVHGTTTVGFTTTLTFGGRDQLVAGDGWLPAVSEGDRYPVVTAQRAYELLKQQPRPMLEMCMRRPDGKPGCADFPPTVITGATLGLSMAQDNGRPTVVPAWLFSVKGQKEPLVQVAVEPSYLAPPATTPKPDTKPVVTPVGVSPA